MLERQRQAKEHRDYVWQGLKPLSDRRICRQFVQIRTRLSTRATFP
jgi:hypothetical protein